MKQRLTKEEAKQISLKALDSLAKTSPIEISLHPVTAYIIALNLPIAFGHPVNTSENPIAVETMESFCRELQQILGERSPEASQLIEEALSVDFWGGIE